MGFYDIIAKDIPWEITQNTDGYLKVKNGKLQLPNPKWLQYHLRYLDNVIEAIHAYRGGALVTETVDVYELIDGEIISDPEKGIEFLEFLEKNYALFSIDIESDNLSTDKTKNKILCIGIAYEPFKGVSFRDKCFVSPAFRAKFQAFVNSTQNRFILHNGVYDRSRTRIIEDITLKIDEDTLLLHYTSINEHKGTHGLKDLAQLYLGFPDWEADLDDWKRKFCRANKIKISEFQYSYYPWQTLCEYNIIDCCATFQLFQVFKKLARPSANYIYRKLVEGAAFYADMIIRGMRLNIPYWEQLKKQFEEELEGYTAIFAKEAPGVKLSSPVQLKKWLTARFPNEWIETTGKEVIADLAEKYPEDIALGTLAKFRKTYKYLKTYVNGLWARKDFQDIIHCEFKLHGTETGRLSSSNPNMQNIPRSKLIKSLFIAREGYTLLQFDFSQLELRVLAHISGDENLIKVYQDDRDLHWETQSLLFESKAVHEDKEQRMAAKIVNFGIPYGRTPSGVAKKYKEDTRKVMSASDAKRFIGAWLDGYPKVKQYIRKCHSMAKADPQDIWYTDFGRARHYFVTSENIYHTENQSVNFPVTSTANDLTIHALIEIGQWLKQEELDAYLVNSVHDSIILEVRPWDVQKITEKGKEIMAAVPPKYLVGTKVPFKADADVGTCWGEMKEPEFDVEEEEEVYENTSD